jgi:hypothetical protein
MSTFYILPPRECLEQAVTSFLDRLIPGLPVPERLCERIFENLGENPDAFLVHREELSGLAELSEDLAENFGAEPEDRRSRNATRNPNGPGAHLDNAACRSRPPCRLIEYNDAQRKHPKPCQPPRRTTPELADELDRYF